jgi:hypothetical protein
MSRITYDIAVSPIVGNPAPIWRYCGITSRENAIATASDLFNTNMFYQVTVCEGTKESKIIHYFEIKRKVK